MNALPFVMRELAADVPTSLRPLYELVDALIEGIVLQMDRCSYEHRSIRKPSTPPH